FIFYISENRRNALIKRLLYVGTNSVIKGFSSSASSHSSSRKLEGKVALITGGASGIGKATAGKFISHGAKVVIADIQPQLGKETEQELGPNAAFCLCDVTKESDIANAVDYAVSLHTKLDIMYNNAGIPCKTPPSIVDLDLNVFDKVLIIQEHTREQVLFYVFLQVINTNVRGVIAGIKHAARVMIPRNSGSIICAGSVTGMMGGLAQHTYSVSKSAVIGIVRSTASELCRHRIRVNCISPFAITTSFVMDEMRQMYPNLDDSRLIKIVHGTGVLNGEVCEPVDVTNAVVYLASDDSKYVNGHNLVVDGGFTTVKSLDFPAPDQV
ncbi:unnamed protein product, partial [Brassica oleracea]